MSDSGSLGRAARIIARKRILAAIALTSMGLFLGVGTTVGSAGIRHFDSVVRNVVYDHASPPLTWLMRQATQMGSTPVVTIVSMVGVLCFFLLRRVRPGVLLAVGIGVAIFLNTFLKDVFHRQRPEPFFGTILPSSFSYPSGHALFSVCCYGMLAVLVAVRLTSRPAKVAVLLAGGIMVAAIGFSRVYLGVHYPSDVVGGWAFALAWTCALLLFDDKGVVAGSVASQPNT